MIISKLENYDDTFDRYSGKCLLLRLPLHHLRLAVSSGLPYLLLNILAARCCQAKCIGTGGYRGMFTLFTACGTKSLRH